jgi:FLYWCH zinc finger domain
LIFLQLTLFSSPILSGFKLRQEVVYIKSMDETNKQKPSQVLTVAPIMATCRMDYDNAGRVKYLVCNGFRYIKNNKHGNKIYWNCTKFRAKCRARVITEVDDPNKCIVKNGHNHFSMSLS